MLQEHRRVKLENPPPLSPCLSLPFSPPPHPSLQFSFSYLAVIRLSVFGDEPKENKHSIANF
jgi:hypothetical protein